MMLNLSQTQWNEMARLVQKRLIFVAPKFRTKEGEDAETLGQVAGADKKKLTGHDDLAGLLKKQEELEQMGGTQFRVEYGYTGSDGPDLETAKIIEHERLTEEFKKRIPEAEMRGLESVTGIDPAHIADLQNELDNALTAAQPALMNDPNIVTILKGMNERGAITPDLPQKLSFAYLQYKLNKNTLERLQKAKADLDKKIEKSQKTSAELKKEYEENKKEHIADYPVFSIVMNRFSWLAHQGRRFKNWIRGKNYGLTEQVQGAALRISQIKARLKPAKDAFEATEADLNGLKADYENKREMANALSEALHAKMEALRMTKASLNRRISGRAAAMAGSLDAQRNQIITQINALEKAHVLAQALSGAMNQLGVQAEKAPIGLLELHALSEDLDKEGVKAAYEKVAQRSMGRAREARKEIGEISTEGIQEEFSKLTRIETSSLVGLFRGVGRTNRHPEEHAEIFQRRSFEFLQESHPRIFELAEQLTKLAPEDLVHHKIFRIMRGALETQNTEFEAAALAARAEFTALAPAVRDRLREKHVLDHCIAGEFLELPEDFFENDLRTEAQLGKYLLQKATFEQLKSWAHLLRRLHHGEIVILPDGNVRSMETHRETTRAEVRALFDNPHRLSAEMATNLKADIRHFKGLCMRLAVANANTLPESITAASLDAYLAQCSPAQLAVVQAGIDQINARCMADGREVVEAEVRLRREAITAFREMVRRGGPALRYADAYIRANPGNALEEMRTHLVNSGQLGDRTPFSPVPPGGFPAGTPSIEEFLNHVPNLQDLMKLKSIFEHAPGQLVATDLKADWSGKGAPNEYQILSIVDTIRDCNFFMSEINISIAGQLLHGCPFNSIKRIYTQSAGGARDIMPLIFPSRTGALTTFDGHELRIAGQELSAHPEWLPYIRQNLVVLRASVDIANSATTQYLSVADEGTDKVLRPTIAIAGPLFAPEGIAV